ncbi:MAG: C/D box methylation guide ribonucleoprotein complex aNOP56 subunit [Theionarchaea archaeon]|nr:C/D box methylation guide ribonucleoprotein complex aNOP56 subunit [Theionarchaea archaeon]
MFGSIHACGMYICNEETSNFIPLTLDQFLGLKRGEKIPEIAQIVEENNVILEQDDIASLFDVPCQFPNPAGEFLRGNLHEIAEEHDINVRERLHSVSLSLTKEYVRKSSEKKDKLIVESVRALNEIDQVLNILSERLREWYSLYSPELDKKVSDNYAYAQRVYKGAAPKDSMGAHLEVRDDEAIREFAKRIIDLFEERKILEDYITEETTKIAPNLTSLLGAVLSARLMSSAGGLEELARLPSSTIQVLGAEKALFRHLRTGAKPPKHGLIFQHPLVNRAPKKARGKISRSLAAKIAILSRVDCYSSEFVADEVEGKLQERISRIKGGQK